VIAVPRYSGPGDVPETAFVLAIIRQETEFDPNSVSGAGARGIMQLMPDSARRDAGRAGLSYNLSSLTTDAAYNIETRNDGTGRRPIGVGRVPMCSPPRRTMQAAETYGNGLRRLEILETRALTPSTGSNKSPSADPKLCAACARKHAGLPQSPCRPRRAAAHSCGPLSAYGSAISLLRYAPPDATTTLPEPKASTRPRRTEPVWPSANTVEPGATVPTAPASTVTPTFKPAADTPGSSE